MSKELKFKKSVKRSKTEPELGSIINYTPPTDAYYDGGKIKYYLGDEVGQWVNKKDLPVPPKISQEYYEQQMIKIDEQAPTLSLNIKDEARLWEDKNDTENGNNI